MPRILTYNVHRCLGLDGLLSPERIAEVVAASRADIVALQELDVGRARTEGVDQAHAIARALGMQMHFHPALRVMEELFGDAILTAWPSRLVRTGSLPGVRGLRRLEPRGALWAAVTIEGLELQVINTHLGLIAHERRMQADALLGEDWLGHPDCRDPAILLGDFNAVPRSRTYRRLAAHLTDVQRTPCAGPPLATFPARLPVLRIDHVFVRGSIEVVRVETLSTPVARIASDHLPLVVEFEIMPAAAQPTPGIAAAAAAAAPPCDETIAAGGRWTWADRDMGGS